MLLQGLPCLRYVNEVRRIVHVDRWQVSNAFGHDLPGRCLVTTVQPCSRSSGFTAEGRTVSSVPTHSCPGTGEMTCTTSVITDFIACGTLRMASRNCRNLLPCNGLVKNLPPSHRSGSTELGFSLAQSDQL